jgi:ADP-ribosyl-[dinitrogen reductase] hydrolase
MKNNLKNTIKGALYGIAVGDALGAPLEFMNAEQIANRYGEVTDMIGGGWLNVEPGEITDDTQMTLAVAEGIAEEPENPIEAIGERFIAWARSGPKDIGGTCSRSIYGAAAGGAKRPTEDEWFNASKATAKANGRRSGGNGALMRTVYPGLYYSQRLEAVEVATAIAQMTHWDEESNRACEIYTDMLYLITEAVNKQGDTADKDKIIDETLQGTPYELDRLAKTTEELNPTGYVVDSMKCAVTAAFWNAESFEEAIVAAANMGGDADTIAAITGGLAGAYYGYDAIPERWIKELAPEVKERLDRLTEVALKNRTMEQRRD